MQSKSLCVLLTLFVLTIGDKPVLGEEGLELQYTGTVASTNRGATGEPVKNFSLHLIETAKTDPALAATYYFVVEERGSGRSPWPERFGITSTKENAEQSANNSARIMFRFGTEDYFISLPTFQHFDQLIEDGNWVDKELTYKVVGSKKIGDSDCWQVLATDQVGRQHTWSINKENHQLVAAAKTFTVGRGDNFRLQIKLTSQDVLDNAAYNQAKKTIDILLKLQENLDRKPGNTDDDLSALQLKEVAAVIDDLKLTTPPKPYQQLIQIISRDLKSQQQRVSDVSQLASQFKKKPAPEFQITTLTGQTIDPLKQHPNSIVVLHFWKYRDTPLKEPYGQIGYLDFLYNKHKAAGVQVYGIAVNPRLADPTLAMAAKRSARKLREFMNLSYPIGLDSGELLKRFGDPRRVDAQLPLWVVIAPDGKIVEYHAGTYNINPVEGLKHLDLLIRRIDRKNQKSKSN